MVRIKGYIDLYEHQVPIDLKFDLHVSSVVDAMDHSDDDYFALSEYMRNYLSVSIIVEEYDLYA